MVNDGMEGTLFALGPRAFSRVMLRFVLRATGACALLGVALLGSCQKNQQQDLQFYCAASQRSVMDPVLALYDKEFSQTINVQYGGSGAMLAQLELAGGDIFLPADQSYLEHVKYARESHALVELVPVVLVQARNPHNIQTLADLAKPGLRLCVGDASSAIGEMTRRILQETGLEGSVMSRVVVERPTVVGVGETVQLGAVDAGIVWKSTAQLYASKCEFIQCVDNGIYKTQARIALCSKDKARREQGQRFIDFLLTDQRVEALYSKHGYRWIGQ